MQYDFTNGDATLNEDECPAFRPVPLPPSGDLRVRDVTHSTMVLDWDAAPGPVRKYLITYKPDEGEAKEVSYVLLLD